MKAVRIHQHGDFDVMRVDDVELPRPQQGQVLIKIAVAGVNYADALLRMGVLASYATPPSLPLTLGFEAAGTIEEMGANVAGLQKGMRVATLVDGGYAEYALAEASNVIPLLDEVDFAPAVMIPVQGQTAYLALKTASLRQGEIVLVHSAAGGVGSIAIQIAKLLGAKLVIGTTTSEEKEGFIRSLGADVVVRTNEAHWVEQVMQATDGRGIDVLLETIGGEVGKQSLNCLAPFGRMVVYGTLTGQPIVFAAQELIGKCASVIGYNTNVQSPEVQKHASQELLRYIASGQLRVTSDSSFPLAEAGEAQKALFTRKTRGKVILTV